MVASRSKADIGAELPVGVSATVLAAQFPKLYHMAEDGSWDSIRRHGLLSTSALLDLFEVCGREREILESHRRPESHTIRHAKHGVAVIRDQKPMDDKGLIRALGDGLTPRDWYELLNGRVFFWVREERLRRLLGARAYRGKRHTVLTVNTARLLSRHQGSVVLSPMNSGATKPMPFPRGRDTFLPLTQYPFAKWQKKRPRGDEVVELAVLQGVADIADLVERVEIVEGDVTIDVLWTRSPR